MDIDAEGAVGYHDRMDPSYTIFHKESETFSSLWTAYTPDLAAFCGAWEADMAQFGTVPGPVARAPEPGQGIFNVSAVPWTSFTGFNLNLQKGYDYLPPIFTLGKYRTEHGRTLDVYKRQPLHRRLLRCGPDRHGGGTDGGPGGIDHRRVGRICAQIQGSGALGGTAGPLCGLR